VHIVWEEGRYIYHRYGSGDTWSPLLRVATGERPAIAIDHNDVVHLVFVNEFRNNYEIYHCQWTGVSWTLPRNVSSTSGVSSIPDIAIDSHNTVHVTWTDNSPGYNVIYHGLWTGTFWINRPIPNARGSVSAIAIGGDDVVHVVWQDRESFTDPYEIYHAERNGAEWIVAVNISDSPDESTIPDLAVGRDGLTHVIWEERVEGRYQIYYCRGRDFSWSVQENISPTPDNSYLPSITVDGDGFPHVSWDESDQLPYFWRQASLPWIAGSSIAQSPEGIADVVLFAEDEGRIHSAWAQRLPDGNWEIFYSSHAPFFLYRARLPVIMCASSR